MKFKSILWKSHVTNQYPIARLWVTVFIGEQKQVITIHLKPICRQLCSELTTCFRYHLSRGPTFSP